MPSTTYSIATKYNLSKSCFFIFTVQNNVQRQMFRVIIRIIASVRNIATLNFGQHFTVHVKFENKKSHHKFTLIINVSLYLSGVNTITKNPDLRFHLPKSQNLNFYEHFRFR